MEQLFSHSTKWEKDTVAIIHIYGARSIFYYFIMTKTLKMSKLK